MRFEISDNKKRDQFIYIFNYLKNFTDKLCLNLSEDKLYIQGMDNSHICIYELFLVNTWFDVWDVQESKTYGVSLPIFNKILHICSEKQKIIITSETDDKLDIEFISDEKGEFNKYFSMSLFDIDVEMMSIPDQEYDVDMEMESKKFKSLIDELTNFNDTLSIVCSEEEVLLESESEEGKMKVVINIDDIELLAVVEDKTIEVSFGIKYISQMCQFYKLAANCAIHISEGIPLLFKYDLGDDCLMRFYLAPKIAD
jgi:proliferating cell nuclear antigen